MKTIKKTCHLSILICMVLLSACTIISPELIKPPGGAPTVEPTVSSEKDETNETNETSDLIISTELGQSFSLRLGQKVIVQSEQLEIKYADFIEDTRCPPDRDCEWPGEIVIWLTARQAGADLGGFRLGTYNGQVIIAAYIVTVIEVIDDDAFTLIITKQEPETVSATATAPSISSVSTPSSTTLSPAFHDCAYGESYYVAAEAGEPEIHIIGVYETSTEHHLPGTADIYVERQARPLVLVLSAYEATQWRLHQAEGVTIEKIVLNGYEAHSVVGAGAIPVIDWSGPGSYLSACAYTWPASDGGCDTPKLVSAVETWLETPITSFQGCYRATEISLK